MEKEICNILFVIFQQKTLLSQPTFGLFALVTVKCFKSQAKHNEEPK